jgi:hypothetical protein
MLTIDVFFTGGWDLDVYDAVFIVDGTGKVAEARHADVCVED